MFWLKKWRFYRGLSKKNQADWTKAIQLTKGTIFEKNILLYIKRVIKTGHFVDVPCYIEDKDLEKSRHFTYFQVFDKLVEEDWGEENNYYGILQLLAPLVENPGDEIYNAAECGDIDVIKILAAIIENPNEISMNEVDEYAATPISAAVRNECVEVIEFLVPLTKYPNLPDKHTDTPIHKAARCGYTEIIKILVSAANVNPNVVNDYGYTAFDLAIMNGHLEIVKILAPFTENVNFSQSKQADGYTPILEAAFHGYIDIIKYLTSLTKNVNVPDDIGRTPLDVAKQHGHDEVVRFLQNFLE